MKIIIMSLYLSIITILLIIVGIIIILLRNNCISRIKELTEHNEISNKPKFIDNILTDDLDQFFPLIILRKFQSKELNNLKRKTNIYTIIFYFVLISIITLFFYSI